MRVLLLALAFLAVLALAALVMLRDTAALRRRVESLFRRPDKPPKPPGPDHYYRPYWS
jgi:hypothetical protein